MKDSNMQVKVGEKIKTLRISKKITQYDLALECGFEKASMSRIESGQSNPTLRTLCRISKALDVPIVEFFKD